MGQLPIVGEVEKWTPHPSYHPCLPGFLPLDKYMRLPAKEIAANDIMGRPCALRGRSRKLSTYWGFADLAQAGAV